MVRRNPADPAKLPDSPVQRGAAKSVIACALLGLAVSCRSGADGDPWAMDEGVHSETEADDEDTQTDDDDDVSDEPVDAEDSDKHDPDDSDTEPALDDGATDDTPPRCEPSNEICDELDNDCDGEVDEGYICPADGTIVGAEPFEGGVYFVGTTAEGSAGATAIQRFWPSLHDSYINGFGYYDGDFVLRRSDLQLFYLDTAKLYGRVTGELPLTGCSATMLTHYDFDGSDRLHYQCPDGLFRGDGEFVADDVGRLLGVTDDGRMALFGGQRFSYIDADGELHDSELFVSGSLVFESSRSLGDSVLSVYHRDTPEPEQLVFKFDENSEWTLMRRIPTALISSAAVALPDGTLFLESAERIIGFMPDGTEEVVWEETDDKTVRMHGGVALFVGPLDPSAIVQ